MAAIARSQTPRTLDALPAHVVQRLSLWLELPDVCSLRSVSKDLAQVFTQTFENHVKSKTILLTSAEQLQEFIYHTQPGRIGRVLQHLTLAGIVSAVSDEFSEYANTLTSAFTNLRLNSAQFVLHSITLTVQCQDENGTTVPREKWRDWQQIWKVAGHTFRSMARSLADSRLQVCKLDLFHGVTSCSLGCDEFGPILSMVEQSWSLASLKDLSVSLSHHVAGKDSDQDECSVAGRTHVKHIARFLELCPHLETLSLRWYTLASGEDLTDAQIEEESFFTHVGQLEQLPKLRCCSLAGIHTNANTLLLFFKKTTNLTRVSMAWIHLSEGKFGPVLNYLTRSITTLDCLHLDDLWESKRICFDAPGSAGMLPSVPSSVTNGPSTLTREGGACRQPIRSRHVKGQMAGSAQASNWMRKKHQLYGPPGMLLWP